MFAERTTNNLSTTEAYDVWDEGWSHNPALYVMYRVCTFPFRPVISTNGCAYKTLATGKMARMLLLSLSFICSGVCVCPCVHVCVRV